MVKTNFLDYINSINESRIKTHGVKHVDRILTKFLNSNYLNFLLNINLNTDDFQLTIYNNGKLYIENFNVIINMCENLGYFPSFLLVDNKSIFNIYKEIKNKNKGKIINNIRKYKSLKNYDIDFLDYIKNIDLSDFNTIIIQFESWQDRDIDFNDIPDILYHVCRKTDVDKILKTGLYPKSKSKISYHPERIYFSDTLIGAYSIINQFKTIENVEYSILIIKPDDDLKRILYLKKDPNYNDGFYTTTNISYNYIYEI